MALANRIVLTDDPDVDWEEPVFMEFKLTYAGQLRAASSAKHKHEIRKAFHPQLKLLWSATFLKEMEDPLPTAPWRDASANYIPRTEALASKFSRSNYHFIPLVTRDLTLLCGLDILFLREDPPGSIIQSGDIDNRIKTLFDALRMPSGASELGGYDIPDQGEDPFYCLLEDDSLITRVAVETDILLQPISSPPDTSDCRLVITVKLRPHEGSWGNIDFL